MQLNEHIVEYLDYYISLKNAPNYAVLLSGNWGSGKSWFIKKYIESKKAKSSTNDFIQNINRRKNWLNKVLNKPNDQVLHNNEFKFLSISLYGIASYDDIEKAFFKELHPFLASEGLKLVGAIFKGIVKSTIKIDLDLIGDNKNDASVSTVIPDVQLVKSLKENKDCVLVFDDLERCSIPLRDILGYINQLVENDNIKVIIIANEEELIKKDESDKEANGIRLDSYRKVKEKLIGKTFEVQTDIDLAINDFIGQLIDNKVKLFFESHHSLLISLFKRSEYNNLRHLRQAILDFERFLSYLPKDVLENIDIARKLIEVFFAISFEVKKGVITIEDIKRLDGNNVLLLERRKNENDSDPVMKVIRKYNVFDRYDPIGRELWYDFFRKSSIDKDKVEDQILSSIYYINANTPDWKILSQYISLDQTKFDELYNSVFNKFKDNFYTDSEAVISIVGTLLDLLNKKIIDSSKEEILTIADMNIKYLKENGFLKLEYNQEFYIDYRYLSEDIRKSGEFIAFYKKVKVEAEATKVESLQKKANELLILIDKSVEEFELALSTNSKTYTGLFRTPVLRHIPVNKFVEIFWELAPLDRRQFGNVLIQRYRDDDDNQRLSPELDWLKELEQCIVYTNEHSEERLTKYLVQESFLPKIREAIALLSNSLKS